jgi:bla regulator protein BlaR1
VTAWLTGTFAAVSLLMLLVLALRRPVARAFGAKWAYAFWLVPALRLVLPPVPLFTPDIALPAAAYFIPAAAGGTASLPAQAGPGQWVPFLFATWAGGAVIFLVLQWLGYRAFLRRLDGSARPARPPFFFGIATFVSPEVDGPLALGLLKRRIVVPADFTRRYGALERRLAMLHERTHHRRGDIAWNIAALVVLALNWFNPIAWIAFRAFRTDQELACDAAVASGASAEERHAYALAMVKSASRPGLIAACAMNDAADLKRRLRMMGEHRISRPRSAGGMAAFGVLALTAFTLGVPEARERMTAPLMAAAAPQIAPSKAAPAPAAAPQPARAIRVARAEPRPHRSAAPAIAEAPLPAASQAEPLQFVTSSPMTPLPAAAPEAAAPPLRFAVATTRFVVVREGLSDEQRARVAAAIARAMAQAPNHQTEPGQAPDAPVRAVWVKINVEPHNKGD